MGACVCAYDAVVYDYDDVCRGGPVALSYDRRHRT